MKCNKRQIENETQGDKIEVLELEQAITNIMKRVIISDNQLCKGLLR